MGSSFQTRPFSTIFYEIFLKQTKRSQFSKETRFGQESKFNKEGQLSKEIRLRQGITLSEEN